MRAILVALAACSLSCAAVRRAPEAAKDAAVACAKQDAPAVLALVLELAGDAARYLLAQGSIDWTGLALKAEHEGSAIGQCAFVEFWATMNPPTRVPAVASARLTSDDSAAALERLRAASGGVTWRTAAGRDI